MTARVTRHSCTELVMKPKAIERPMISWQQKGKLRSLNIWTGSTPYSKRKLLIDANAITYFVQRSLFQKTSSCANFRKPVTYLVKQKKYSNKFAMMRSEERRVGKECR